MEKKVLKVKRIKKEEIKYIETGVTKNYNMFYSPEVQRDKKEGSIKNIVGSVQRHGVIAAINVRPSEEYPGKYEIYDGQHVLDAVKSVGLPVVYNVFKDISNKAMIDINNKARSWKLEDYLHYGVVDKIPSYLFINKVFKETKIKLTGLLNIYGGNYSNNSWKDLEWEALSKERGDTILSYINDFGTIYNIEHCRHARFVWGLAMIYDTGKYDHKRMLNQLNKCSAKLTKQAGPGDYAKNIQDVYNHGLSVKNQVQFIQDK